MTRSIIFKTLIDVLFFLLCLGLLSVVFLAPTGFASRSMENKEVENWDVFSWLLLIFSVISYVALLIGIKHLRSASRYMMHQNKFHPKTAILLKKSGQFLIFSSLVGYAIFIVIFFLKLFLDAKFQLILDNSAFLQLFTTIVGLFFILQSEVLQNAADYKEENDLTI